MTSLPKPEERAGGRSLALLVDLDICVGCHACAVNCKEWNTGGRFGPLSDREAYGARPEGAWLNRVHGFEIGEGETGRTVYFPKNCYHCEQAPCVTVCPTGASYKRPEDGIVLVAEDLCMGCGLCAWACPYGAREMDPVEQVMRKCTLCVDRIYNEELEEIDRVPACVVTCPAGARHFGDFADPESEVSRLVRERGGFAVMEELGTAPTARYLPPRRRDPAASPLAPEESASDESASEPLGRLFAWVDRILSD